MNYDTLLEKYRTKQVFIYGRSVIHIVDTQTYIDTGIKKTDFIFHTERNNRGIITVENEDTT
ncbi:MAG: hypothetical protein GY699_11835 [Desulfobacteraceae bacterium]|nr:hypothetical protein [Desulfobacteraceae bacterium]